MKQMNGNLGPRNVDIETRSFAYADIVKTAQITHRKYIPAMDRYVQNTKQTPHQSVINDTIS